MTTDPSADVGPQLNVLRITPVPTERGGTREEVEAIAVDRDETVGELADRLLTVFGATFAGQRIEVRLTASRFGSNVDAPGASLPPLT